VQPNTNRGQTAVRVARLAEKEVVVAIPETRPQHIDGCPSSIKSASLKIKVFSKNVQKAFATSDAAATT
jgi:hypothetical protein